MDEFGAFVAADRRRKLAELIDAELSRPGVLPVIIVPLQTDYAREMAETTGDLHELFRRRAAEIEANGYFVEGFDSVYV